MSQSKSTNSSGNAIANRTRDSVYVVSPNGMIGEVIKKRRHQWGKAPVSVRMQTNFVVELQTSLRQVDAARPPAFKPR